jgi:LCP family protein required for cell wall assembly
MQKKKSRNRWIRLIVLGSVFLIIMCCLFATISQALSIQRQVESGELDVIPIDKVYERDHTLLQEIFGRVQFSDLFSAKALCGNEPELYVLAVGIDQRGNDYLYGLADVIRIVRIDFSKPQINVVALSRATLVNVPEDRLKVTGPMLLNQSYFFGSRGMDYYEGPNYGAGALQETIDYNFGISTDRYLVIDFQAFVKFIDAIGGIEVDLPTYVDDMPNSYFPAGVQTLDGAQALTLARIRSKYSDLIRIDNQTLILKAVIERLKNPLILARLPQIIASLQDAYLTDLSESQITSMICLLPKLDSNNVQFFNPTDELITTDWEFIPNMNQQMEIFRWDQRLVDWIKESLSAEPLP